MVLAATYFGSNGWFIELGETKILLDPWLCGNLTLGPGDWFFKGILKKNKPIPIDAEILLLTQGIADHAHVPTLKKINKQIKSIASQSAGRVLSGIGYKDITIIKPGDITKCCSIEIIATKGAKVPNQENGYILKHKEGSIYIEPHGFFDESIKKEKIDCLITPVVNLGIPIAGEFIKGKSNLNKMIKHFNPRVILASTTGGDIEFKGILNKLIYQKGTISDIKKNIDDKIKFINPIMDFRYNLD